MAMAPLLLNPNGLKMYLMAMVLHQLQWATLCMALKWHNRIPTGKVGIPKLTNPGSFQFLVGRLTKILLNLKQT